MKKTFSICILWVLILALTVPMSAFAAPAATEEIAPQASCSHTSYTTTYAYTYVYMNDNYHEVYRTEKRQCKSCKDVFYVGNPMPMPLEEHSGSLTYQYSVHVGDFTDHYYMYSGYCPQCKEVYEERRDAACRKGNCVDPQSLRKPVYLVK